MKAVEATEVKGSMSLDAARETKAIFMAMALQVDMLAKKYELGQNGIMCTLMCLMYEFLKSENIDVDAILKEWRAV